MPNDLTTQSKYLKNYGKVTTASAYDFFINDPVELCKFNYTKSYIIQMAFKTGAKVDMVSKIVFKTKKPADLEEKKWFDQYNCGIITYNGKRGYIYCMDTARFYHFSHDANPCIDHTKPLTYKEMIKTEQKKARLDHINNIIASESAAFTYIKESLDRIRNKK